MRGHRVVQAFASASGKMELSLRISIKNINLDNSRAVGKRNWKETASSDVQIVIKYIDGASPRGHHQKYAFLCRENHTSWRLEDTQGEFSDHLWPVCYIKGMVSTAASATQSIWIWFQNPGNKAEHSFPRRFKILQGHLSSTFETMSNFHQNVSERPLDDDLWS